ncbi:MAG: hypothetical protein KatS3mg081_2477 [Gemmatimonadales bacterium]|nr:hypothetical protein HRbin33_01516 [bacterium HR33]GIW53122.1 MAG: hypothetical protein KatS3mg081_2477 [Gemmatimonadales bacterium]
MKFKAGWTIAILLLLACENGAGPLGSNVQVSFATRSSSASPPAAAGLDGSTPASDTIRDGTNVLVITKAEIVLREIEFERQEAGNCDANPAACEDVELGPVLVDLPLTPGAVQRFQVDLPQGTYVEVEFEIHKVSDDDPADAVFRQQHPDFIDKSIRVQGTFNGQAFVFETDLNVDQELDLVPPLVIGEGVSGTNVTIFVSLADWFKGPDGKLLDPATGNKGQPNESLIKNNIQRSMEAFEDRDGDGRRGS